jgi:predicted metal-dependent peptidase
MSESQTDWKIAAEQAARLSKLAGKLPGGIGRLVSESRQPAVDWREVLREFTARHLVTDYTWSPPNRRFVHAGLYLPSPLKTGTGRMDFHIDVSGSVDQATLDQMAAEVTAVSEDVRPEAIRVLYFDSKLQSIVEFEKGEHVTLKAQGGGGTDFRPSFAAVEESGEIPVCAVVLTDMQCWQYPADPGYPVLWARVGSGGSVPPFGELVDVI